MRAITALLRPGDIVIDIGANQGAYAIFCANTIGPRGRVYAVEPNPNCCKAISQQATRDCRFSNLSVHALALSNSNSTATLHVPDDDPGQASLTPHRDLGSWSAVTSTTTFEVATMTLDRFVEVNALDVVDFLKIDVEGGEQRVLEGAEAVLRRLQPILLLELCDLWLRDFGSDSRATISFLRHLGYDQLVDVASGEQLDADTADRDPVTHRNVACLMTERHRDSLARLRAELRS